MGIEEEIELWGESKIPDAKVVEADWMKGNERVPQKGTQLAFIPEHQIEYQRCRESIEYFAENYYKIDLGKGKVGLMPLWDIQREALQYFLDNNRVVMNSSRQTSKTTLMVLFVLWKLCFADTKQVIGLLGNNMGLAQENLNKIKDAYEKLPLFLKPAITKWNEYRIHFTNKNIVKISATTGSPFRGSTLTSLVIDEASFINDQGMQGLDKKIMKSVLPTLDRAGEDGFFIMISTPNGLDNLFAELYFKAKKFAEGGFEDGDENETAWRAFEILWSDHPERDDQWKINKLKEMSEEDFAEEFGGDWNRGSGQVRLVTAERLVDMEDELEDPIYTENKDLSEQNIEEDQSLQVWEFPKEDKIYLAGVDVGEGVGECSSVVQILDVTDLYDIKQVAEYHSNEVSIEEFALVCLEMFNRYNQCYASVEDNGCGKELLSLLTKTHNYPKLVRYHYNEEALKTMVKRNQFGVHSCNNSKKICISNIRHFYNKREAITIKSKRYHKELGTFVKKKLKGSGNAKWERSSQSVYDDLVDALNWTLLPLHSNLAETYFKLGNPKFDKASKPHNILYELISGQTDPRKYQTELPINNPTINVSIYFGNEPQSINTQTSDQGFIGTNEDWLNNF